MFPTNRTLTITRKGDPVATVDAHVEPASDELRAMLGSPATLLFNIFLPELPDVRIQDRLIATDTAEQYQVIGVKPYDVDLVRHTQVTAEAKWGSQ